MIYSANEHVLACSSRDGNIYLWNVRLRQTIIDIRSPFSRADSGSFGSAGDLFAFVASSKSVCIWHLKLGTLQHTLSNYDSDVRSVRFASNERLVTHCEYCIVAHDARLEKQLFQISSRESNLSHDGKQLHVYIDYDNSTKLDIHDSESGKLHHTITFGQPILRPKFSFGN